MYSLIIFECYCYRERKSLVYKGETNALDMNLWRMLEPHSVVAPLIKNDSCLLTSPSNCESMDIVKFALLGWTVTN
jgi:hypothetical protein